MSSLSTIFQTIFSHLIDAEFWHYIFKSNIINMIIVFAFLVWLVKKVNIMAFLKLYQKDIEETIQKVEDDKRVAQNVLQQMKENAHEIKNDVARIVDEAKSSAQIMENRINYETEKKVDEINQNLNKMIDIESKSMKERLTQNLSEKAYEEAEQKIKDTLTHELHLEYINNFIENLDENKVN